MPTGSGISGQIGYAAETTWNTYKAPDHFVEVAAESLALDVQRIESKGVRAGNLVQRSDRWVGNKIGVGGSVDFEISSKGFGLWLKHLLGTQATSTPSGGTSSKQYSSTLGDPYGLGLTIQVGRPANDGTVDPFSYTGCKLLDGDFKNTVDGLLMLTTTIDGADETTAQSLAAASYASSSELLSFVGGSLTIAGTAVATVSDISVKIARPYKTDRRFIRANTVKKEPIINGLTLITGTVTTEFESLTAYNRFVNGTTAAIVCDWLGLTALEGSIYPELKITLPVCRFDGTTPNLNGEDMLHLTLPFKALYDGSQEPVTVDYVSLDATA